MSLRALVLPALVALLAGCGKGEEPKKKNEAPPAQPAPVVPEAPRESPVDIHVSANGSVEGTVAADSPIVVEVDIFLNRSAGPSLTLANPSGAWSDAFSLQCTGPGDADRSSLFAPAYTTKSSIDLTRERSGRLVWILDGAGASVLPEGTWTIRAIVDEKKLGGALPPGLGSGPATVTVVAAAAVSTPGAAQRKCLAVMHAAALKKDPARALAAAETHLARNPDDVPVLFKKGQILRSQGKNEEALASFESSLRAAKKDPDVMAENFAIERAIAEVRRELAPKQPR